MTDRRASAHDLSLGREASAAEGDLRLPTAPGVIRRFWARHPWWTDSLIAAIYLIPALAGSITLMVERSGAASGVIEPILALVSGAGVLFRRRTPLFALAVTIGCAALTIASDGGFLVVGILFALYAVAVYRSNRAAWIGLASAAAVLIVAVLVPSPALAQFDTANHPLTMWLVFLLLTVLIGVNVGNRRRYLEALIDRAAQLARERDQQAQLATAAERSRIAREMHDIVSHSLTVMVTLADGSAALAATAPDRAEQAMRQVAETGRHALTDMRRMLGVLIEPVTAGDAALEPQPGSSDVAEVVERFRAAGLPARLTITGAAPDDTGLQLTVYRVVQESLTNVLRHASGAAQVDVTVTYGEAVTIRVDDSGVAHDPALASGSSPATHGAGRGLVGMRERVALYHGTLQSGPRQSGGWRVAATLHPLENGEST